MKNCLVSVTVLLIHYGLCICPSFAQQSIIKGKVTDETLSPVRNARVSIDGSDFVLTSSNGDFTIPTENQSKDKPKAVRADKSGLSMKAWKFEQGQVKVIMQPSKIIRGRVISDKGVPVEGIRVLLAGIRGLDAVKTDSKGNFTMEVPKDTKIDATTAFVVYDPGRLKGTANFDLSIGDDGTIYLKVDIPPRIVRKVKVIDENNNAVPEAIVLIDGSNYTTDKTGEAEVSNNVNDFSSYQAEKLFIDKLEYVDKGSVMKIFVIVPREGEPLLQQGARTLIDDRKDMALIENYFLNRRQTILRGRIADIQAQLENQNITAEQRQQLQEELRVLGIESDRTKDLIEIATERAEETILLIQKRFKEAEEELQKFKDKLIQSELTKKLAQERTTIYIIIFGVVALALSSVVFTFYVNNKKINKQKNQLAEKITEINQKNELLEESARMMDIKNREIRTKNDQLLEQTHELEEINNKLTDSIRYARNIQQSILPSDTVMTEALKDYFIFFEPRDIVSGDFYWFSQKGNELIVIVADCTGHGVPGAFMTMMGYTLLNQIVNENNITDPAEILFELNLQVLSTLKQESQEQDRKRDGDGMDVALLNINLATRKATFAGAKNPLYYIRDNELYYLKGSNISIGSTLGKKNKVFDNNSFYMQGGETFYLVSDGFQDQLGGANAGELHKRKKFMKTRFMDLLLECSKLQMHDQKTKFRREFHDWKRDNDQTDDVLIIGLKV